MTYSMLMPSSSLQFERADDDLRLDGDVERRRRLIAQKQFWPTGQRGRDHDALAQTAGQFVRVEREAGFRVGDAHLSRERSACWRCLGLGPVSAWPAQRQSSGRRPWRSDSATVIGSWKIIVIPVPRMPCKVCLRGPLKDRRRRRARCRRCSTRLAAAVPRIARKVRLFPLPDSPTSPTASPASTWSEMFDGGAVPRLRSPSR